MLCTDQGGDEKGAGGLIDNELLDDLHTFFIHTFCFQHQGSLATKRQLWSSGKMFNDLAKSVNVCRGHGMPTKLFEALVMALGGDVEKARKLGGKLPPRAVRTRWGSVDAASAWFLKIGWVLFRQMWLHVQHAKKARSGKPTKETESVDPLVDEGNAEFTARMGRWEREADVAIMSNTFWALLIVGQVGRSPWAHFTNFLMKALHHLLPF